MTRKDLIESLDSKRKPLQDKIVSWAERIANSNNFAIDILDSESCFESAAQEKVYSLLIQWLESNTVPYAEIQKRINRFIRETARSSHASTSPVYNITQGYYMLRAWTSIEYLLPASLSETEVSEEPAPKGEDR